MLTVDHRGFDPLPEAFSTLTLDGSLTSDLHWKVEVDTPTFWHIDFKIKTLLPPFLASYQRAVRHFNETIYNENTLGVILYQGGIPSCPLEEFADFLHHIAAELPEDVPPFALFDCVGDPLLFSKEIFPHIHLGFRSGPIGVIQWGERLIPKRYDQRIGVALPLREKGLQFDEVDACLKGGSYRLINEPYLTEEWDGLDEIIIFKDLISPWGRRILKGFKAAGGIVKEFGVEGFEPPAFCSQSRRASQAALYPEKDD
jgi:hypothetical protein